MMAKLLLTKKNKKEFSFQQREKKRGNSQQREQHVSRPGHQKDNAVMAGVPEGH